MNGFILYYSPSFVLPLWYKLYVSILYAYTALFALLECFMFSGFLNVD